MPDTHRAGDASPIPTPSSPSLSTAFHRHHQPTPTVEQADPLAVSSLRRRRTRSISEHDHGHGQEHDPRSHVRISIQTPFSDNGAGQGEGSRRKEGWVLPRSLGIKELKDTLARGGLEGGGQWERLGMRLVWQGRIVRDEERLEDVVGRRDPAQTHTLHLVARRLSPPAIAAPPASTPTLSPTPVSIPVSSSSTPTTRASTALSDTVHFLHFKARHHICHLLSCPPLRWDDLIPPPTVAQNVAREAVMTVVRAYAQQRKDMEEGWEDWEKAFDGDDEDSLKRVCVDMRAVQDEVKGLWSVSSGKRWNDAVEGEQTVVEIDSISYELHLPPLYLMTSTQLAQLLLYLRITALLPLLASVLAQQVIPAPAPTPTTTQPPPPNQQVIYRHTFRINFSIPPSIIYHMLFSLVKLIVMLWMLTRDMKWSDIRFWVIGGAALGWWIADGMNRWDRERRQRRLMGTANAAPVVAGADAADPLLPGGANGAPAPNANGVPAHVEADAQVHAAAAARAIAIGAARNPPNPLTSQIPLLHLHLDADQLSLPSSSVHPSGTGATGARAGYTPRPPAWIQTQLLLPIYLWVITLIPEWEMIRSRAIRRRERAIRVLVGELSRGAEVVAEAEAAASGDGIEGGDAGTERLEQGRADGVPRTQPQSQQRTYPPGLNPIAKRYYERVITRGEGIDWEEEREAQRALGVGAEDEDAGAGGLGLGF